ncbi:SMI1/KNR4 family protein [Thioclava sp. GXIMD2076]|uniref:SMI1/KNR4 family protein n=1 Tax=Thioclava sp. GXIMD2076 TaxID=3131931 RepID=UPI0030D16E17
MTDDEFIMTLAEKAGLGRAEIGILGEAQLAEAEARIGVVPPMLLLKLYRAISNGGFGPMRGLMGLGGGATDRAGYTADRLHQLYADPDDGNPARDWPVGLLPICEDGQGSYICVDCFDESLHLWSPEGWDRSQPPQSAITPLAEDLRGWLGAWAGSHCPALAHLHEVPAGSLCLSAR